MERRVVRGISIIELLVAMAVIGILMAMLLPALQSAREAARRMQCASHLRQIGLAIHTYEKTFKAYPPAAVNWSTSGYPNHSCIAFLLPYLEQSNVRDAYQMNVAWNHASNQVATATELPIVRCPTSPHTARFTADYFSCTQFFAGGNAQKACLARNIRPQSWEGFLMQQTKAQYKATIRPAHIRDGLSNTWLYFEDSGRPGRYNIRKKVAVDGYGKQLTAPATDGHWADPQGYFDVHDYCNSLQMINCNNNNEIYSFHKGGCNFVYGDGSVRFEHEKLAPEVFVALFTRAGGDVVRQP